MLDINYKKVFGFGDYIFPELELRPFLLNLPLNNKNVNTRDGIKKKIYRNFSYKIEEYRKELNIFKNEDNIFNLIFDNLESLDDSLARNCPQNLDLNDKDNKIVEDILSLLIDQSICGFIFIIAKPINQEPGKAVNFKPILGAVIELVDDNERAIRMMFCKRRLPYNITERLVRLLIGRVLIHALNWNYSNENKKRRKNSSKLISILDEHIQLFPIPAYNILIKEMNMSAHWELSSKNISHSDSFKVKCHCYKFSKSESSRKFWGISESRYISTIKSNPEIFGSLINSSDFLDCNFFKSVQNNLKHKINDTNTSLSSNSSSDLSSSSINKKRKIS